MKLIDAIKRLERLIGNTKTVDKYRDALNCVLDAIYIMEKDSGTLWGIVIPKNEKIENIIKIAREVSSWFPALKEQKEKVNDAVFEALQSPLRYKR